MFAVHYFLAIIVSLVESHDEDLVKFTAELLIKVFDNPKYICYLGDSNYLIERALILADIAVYNRNCSWVNNRHAWSSVSGYIIFLEDYNQIEEEIFITAEALLPERKVLIFNSEFYMFEKQNFTSMSLFRGNDIYIVNNFSSDFDNSINQTANDIIVVDLIKDKILLKWRKHEDFIIPNDTFKIRNIFKPFFGNKRLKVSVFDCPPFIQYNESLGGFYGGVEKFIFNEVTKGWPIEYIPYPIYGWVPSLRDMQNGKLDVSPCGNWHVRLVDYGVDIVNPYWESCASFLVPKPTVLPPETFVLQPLQILTWCLILLLILLVGITHYYYVSINFNNKQEFSNIILDTFRILLINAVPGLNRKNVLKPIFILWCIICVLLQTCYSAGFTTNLSAPRLATPILLVRDMLLHNLKNNDKGTLKILKDSYNQYVRKSGYHLDVSDYSKAPGTPVFVTNILDVNYLTKENWIDEIGDLDNYTPLLECFGKYNLALGMQVNSAFKQVFSESISKFIEHGLISAWMQMTIYGDMGWTFKAMALMLRNTKGGAQYKPLGWIRLQGAFYLLFIGYVISIIAFLIENIAIIKEAYKCCKLCTCRVIYWKKFY